MSRPHLGTAVCLIPDLFFVAKVESPLQMLGLEVLFAGSVGEFLDALRRHQPILALIDLRARGIDTIGLIATIRTDPDIQGTQLLCFGDHVNAPLLEAAREAGADEVVTNGQLSAHLPTLVSQFL